MPDADVEPDAPPPPPCTVGLDCPEGGMVGLPAGSFLAIEEWVAWIEFHTDAYLVAVTETTQAAYADCVRAGGCTVPLEGGPPPHSLEELSNCEPSDWAPTGRPSYPVVCVTWEQAEAYCRWARRRLCTDAEWRRAAHGLVHAVDGFRHPWGDEDPTCDQAVCSTDGCLWEPWDGHPRLEPVGSRPAGATTEGVLDIVGNADEWVADWLWPVMGCESPCVNPTGPDDPLDNPLGDLRLCRGGTTWRCRHDAVRIEAVGACQPDRASPGLGFRCCADP